MHLENRDRNMGFLEMPLTYMGSKGVKIPKFTFKEVSGNVGGTKIFGDKIQMSVTSSLGNKVHEVSHGFDKSPIGIKDGEEAREVRAYQAQYSADPSSMPPSESTPATPTSVNGVTGTYVGGIMRAITEKNGKVRNEPIYKQTYKKYKESYKKTQ